MKTIVTVLAALTATTPALAQYYDPGPGYYRDRPREYYRERPDIGRHCEAFIRSAYGPQRLFCRIVDPKPIGLGCACPGPSAGPGYPPGPFVGGRTVP